MSREFVQNVIGRRNPMFCMEKSSSRKEYKNIFARPLEKERENAGDGENKMENLH